MCLISDKIKFCTCATGDLSKEKNTWSLYRNIKNFPMILGIAWSPIPMSTLRANRDLLINRLNEPDAFDIDLKPQERDYLLLNFVCGDDETPVQFGFIYSNNRWEVETTMLFFWEIESLKETMGCFESPF